MILKISTISAKDFLISASKKSTIFKERKEVLLRIAEGITTNFLKKGTLNISFISKNNARTSQICQVWAFLASKNFQLPISTFSGGIEVTTFYRNTIRVLQKSGFHFQLDNFSHQNPKYSVSFNNEKTTFLVFSKHYDDVINKEPFIAIMTCKKSMNQFITSSSFINEYHLPYFDLKTIDGSVNQEEKYEAINQQIACEMYFLFSTIKNSLS
jgi:arsenate reductase (thioredoxin)